MYSSNSIHSVLGKRPLDEGASPLGKRVKIEEETVIEEGPIHHLPTEFLIQILSLLSPNHLQSVVTVNHHWSAQSIISGRLRMERSINNFLKIKILPEKLALEQMEKINRVAQGCMPFTSTTLIEVKSSALKTKKEIADILSSLNKNKLNELVEDKEQYLLFYHLFSKSSLSSKNKPPASPIMLVSSEHIFDLARFYRKTHKIIDSLDYKQSNLICSSIVDTLLSKNDRINGATDFFDLLISEQPNDQTLQRVTLALAKASSNKQPISQGIISCLKKKAESINVQCVSDNCLKHFVLHHICNILIKQDKHERALEIANTMSEECMEEIDGLEEISYKSKSLVTISLHLVDKKNFDQAIKIADTIPSIEDEFADDELLYPFLKSFPSCTIGRKIVSVKEVEGDDLKNVSKSKEFLIIYICLSLAKEGEISRAIHLAKTKLENKLRIGRALGYLCLDAINRKQFDDAKRMMYAMDHDEPRKQIALDCLTDLLKTKIRNLKN